MTKRLIAINSKGHQHYKGTLRKNGRWSGVMNMAPEGVLTKPLRWSKPRMIFVNSMSDLFHENVSFDDILRIFMIMAEAEQHTFQILTKRPERMLRFMRDWYPSAMGLATMTLKEWAPLPNVWLGVSVGNQQLPEL